MENKKADFFLLFFDVACLSLSLLSLFLKEKKQEKFNLPTAHVEDPVDCSDV